MPNKPMTVEECLAKMRSEGRLTEGKTAGELFAEKVEKTPQPRMEGVVPFETSARILGVMAKACESEKQFQDVVVSLAQIGRWKCFHWRKVLVKMGERTHYETPFSGDGKGEFDLTLLRERLVRAELKFGKNKPTPEQLERAKDYDRAGVEHYFWWPKDWAEIVRVLAPVPAREPERGRRK